MNPVKLVETVYAELRIHCPTRMVTKIFELTHPDSDGVHVKFLVDCLVVQFRGDTQELSMSVADESEPERWAAVPYLYCYIENKSDLVLIESILNSPIQISWLAENIDRVYSLMCDPNLKLIKEQFFEFQETEHKLYLDRMLRSIQEKRGPAGRS